MDASYVAVIDIGSNSIKSLVAKRGNPIEVIHQGLHETRISSGISQTRPALTEAAMQAGTESVARLYQDTRQWPCQATAIVATSAVRDAANRANFAERIRQATGHPLTILSGEHEAQLIGRGLSADPALHGFDAFSHLDLGGGSLECINYRDGELTQAISLQLGAVRLTEQLIDAPHQPAMTFWSAPGARLQ
jgi:exopolyphosphatase/guanosine-5'-triphosphate,3'-diphosphate pyrophosphatase